MTPEQERAIERYILLPDSLSTDARSAVEALLRSNENVRAWANRLEAIYSTARSLASSPAVNAFVNDLFPVDPVISLHRVPLSRTTGETIQAADAHDARPRPQPDTSNLETRTVVLNEDEGVLVRLLHNPETGSGRLYLLAHDRATWTHALVSIPDLGLDVPTDDSGLGAFTHDTDVADDRFSSLQLRRVLSSHPIADLPPGSEAVQTFDSGHSLRLQRRDNTLHVRLTTQPAAAPTLRRVVIQSPAADGSPVCRVARVEDGTATVPLPPSSDTYTLRLYG